MRKFQKISVSILITLIGLSYSAFSFDVFFIDSPGNHSPSLKNVMLACKFYGLQLETNQAFITAESKDISSFLLENRPSAIIVTALSLADGDLRKALNELRAGKGYHPALLVADLDSSIEPELLKALSAGIFSECVSLEGLPQSGQYNVVGDKGITKHVFMQTYQLYIAEAYVLKGEGHNDAQAIIRLASNNNDSGKPIFAFANYGGVGTFFLSKFRAASMSYLLRPGLERDRLLELLPFLLFLRHACGERCWHSPGYFANLCIDDPWLREPYGHLRYSALLEEMRKANFHTTIAMVPWNYDRSKPSVVSLFLNHVDRFSLCVHGNNHDHREFSENVPLSKQEDDIIQGLARMEAFTRLTGIPYDRIMVFPHSVAQLQTNQILKKNNFLGTVNGENIPPDVERPESLLAYLRNSTLDYGDFLSLKRTRAEWESESNIALNLFLENPILLYSHHGLFRGGPDKFNDMAARINELEPTIRWTSLGTIVKNLYLLRKRARGDYDVLALSPNIEISNPHDIPLRFEIQKPELDSSPLREVLVDGSPYPYERTSGSIHLVLMIPALATREINIEYENDVDLDSVDLSKKNFRVHWLRKISDFRDNFLSLLPLGSNIVGFYYDSGAFRGGSRVVFLFLIVFIGLIAIVSWRIIRRIRKARLKKKALRRPVQN